jgi:hypothetical protein
MMRRGSWLNFRLPPVSTGVIALWAVLLFAGPAIAEQSCSFVYYNTYSETTAATAEAACKLADWTEVNSIGDTITDRFHLGPIQSGDPGNNNASYSCPGRQLVTPSDPTHCPWYGGAGEACTTGSAVSGSEGSTCLSRLHTRQRVSKTFFRAHPAGAV